MTTTASIVTPPGLAGVIVADTAIGDVRGAEGFFHYRQYDATQLARERSFEEVWHLLIRGSLPDAAALRAWTTLTAQAATVPDQLGDRLIDVMRASAGADPLVTLRTALSAYGSLVGDKALWDSDAAAKENAAVRSAAVVPWLVAAAHALGRGEAPRPPRPELGHVGNYLWLVTGVEPTPQHVAALTRYLILTADHGFNNSTFTARTVASTGSELTACLVAGIVVVGSVARRRAEPGPRRPRRDRER